MQVGESVLPIYTESYMQVFRRERREPETDTQALADVNAFFKPIMEALMSWSAKHGISGSENGWVEAHAILCLRGWAENAATREALLPSGVPGRYETKSIAMAFEFSFSGWELTAQDWEKYESSLTAASKTESKRYRDKVRGLALEAGLEKWNDKRARSSNERFVHFEWLALRLCRAMTYDAIAQLYSPQSRLSEDAVRMAVKRSAELIGLKALNRT